MDEDIRQELKAVAAHIHDIARQIESTKSSMESITAMKECLETAARTLNTYLEIMKFRYEMA